MSYETFNSLDPLVTGDLTAPMPLIVLARMLGRLSARQWFTDSIDHPRNPPFTFGGPLGPLLAHPITCIKGSALDGLMI